MSSIYYIRFLNKKYHLINILVSISSVRKSTVFRQKGEKMSCGQPLLSLSICEAYDNFMICKPPAQMMEVYLLDGHCIINSSLEQQKLVFIPIHPQVLGFSSWNFKND